MARRLDNVDGGSPGSVTTHSAQSCRSNPNDGKSLCLSSNPKGSSSNTVLQRVQYFPLNFQPLDCSFGNFK